MVRATPDEKDAFSVQLYGVDPATVGRAVEMLVDEDVAGTRPGAHRPQLRLPGAQGDPQGRGSGAAVAARAVRDIVRVRRPRGRRRAGHRQDPHRHRRRPRHLPRRRPDRRRTRAPPRSRCTAAPPTSSTAAPPTGRPSRGWSRPSTSRCSATATSGRPTTRCAWSPRPAAPASSSAAAASAGRGCSATSPPPSPATPRRALPTLREVAAVMHRHAELLGEEQGERHGCTDFRKHVAWYLKGFSVGSDVRRALAMVSGLDELAELLARHPRPAVPGRRPRRARAAGPARPRPVALPEGWLADRDDPRPPAGRRARGQRRMTRPSGPFLYDDGPAPLHTGTPRRRRGLLLAIFGGDRARRRPHGRAAAAGQGLGRRPVARGRRASSSPLSHKGDTETAYQLLCAAERAGLQPGGRRRRYVVGGARARSVAAVRRPRPAALPSSRCRSAGPTGAQPVHRRRCERAARLRRHLRG